MRAGAARLLHRAISLAWGGLGWPLGGCQGRTHAFPKLTLRSDEPLTPVRWQPRFLLDHPKDDQGTQMRSNGGVTDLQGGCHLMLKERTGRRKYPAIDPQSLAVPEQVFTYVICTMRYWHRDSRIANSDSRFAQTGQDTHEERPMTTRTRALDLRADCEAGSRCLHSRTCARRVGGS
jgi:hypothetical protein